MEAALRELHLLRLWYPYDGPQGPDAKVPRDFRAPLEDLAQHLGVTTDRLVHVVQAHDTRGALTLHSLSVDDARVFISRTA